MGLLIEETQRRLKEQQDKQLTLQRQLTQFCTLQVAYMPCVGPLVEEALAKVDGVEDVEHTNLWLPLVLMAEQRALSCKGNVIKIEEDL
ncbi:hypothetical protein EV421DRAFT_1910719 [Armillaria borealis]|uniref:Uncharacterized protein n=1 Tax=Armillaria borealis TaxID=47425 RepID=A0AA39IZV2_9AGAR|nr:hypothetical protein EV421DRAFT_1910719 [Armillaria borealis]